MTSPAAPAPGRRWLTGREVRNAVATEILDELRYLRSHLTQAAERTGTGVVNHVLEVGTRVFDADGRVVLEWGVPCGAIEVSMHGNGDCTVVASGPSSAAGTPGGAIGRYVVPQDAVRVVNVASRQVTLYGTPGEEVSYQAYTVGSATQPLLRAAQ